MTKLIPFMIKSVFYLLPCTTLMLASPSIVRDGNKGKCCKKGGKKLSLMGNKEVMKVIISFRARSLTHSLTLAC